MDFVNKDALEEWLAENGIETATWGMGGAKSIANLWHEYQQGEIAFRDEPPLRRVQVVQIILRRDGLVLYEIAQEFFDGNQRRRQRPPSEKIFAGESQFAAAERCLREELGLDPREIRLLNAATGVSENLDESPSYPGLQTHYTLYTVEATVEGLPEDDFWRENEAAGESDPVRRHLWGWR